MAINKELLQKTLDTIKANPQHWKQDTWHCGTSHCFAGFAELIGNNIPISISDKELRDIKLHTNLRWSTCLNAEELLGITDADSDILFYGYNTLEQLERMIAHLIEHSSLEDFGDYLIE